MKKVNLNPELAVLLSQSKGLREFLLATDELLRQHSFYSYAAISRRAGFASRSYVRAVFKGERSLTRDALPKIALGLGLNQKVQKGISLLMELADASPAKKEQIHQRLKKLAHQQQSSSTRRELGQFQHFLWPFVYAALGSPEKGKTLAEMALQLKMNEQDLSMILQDMMEQGVVLRKKDRFCAGQDFLEFTGLKGEANYRRFFNHSLELVRQRLPEKIKSKDHLFFASTYSVTEERLPELTKKLQALLMEFAENAEESEGDQVALMEASLIPY